MDKSPDRRHHARFPLSLRATVRALAPYGVRGAPALTVHGRLRNIGEGGVGLVADWALPVSRLAECRIFLPSVTVPIPTLLSVRWSRKHPSGGRHDIGLQFLMDTAQERVLLTMPVRGTRE